MESVLIWTFGIVFGLWLLLTIVASLHYHSLLRLRIPAPIRDLIPNWNLFAPKPGVADYYIMYRDQRGAEDPGPWLIAHGPEARQWFHGFWNPNKVQAKAVFDLVQQLAALIVKMKEGEEEALLQSAPFQHLLHFVRHLPRQEASERTQFAIVVQEPAHQYEATMLVSTFYEL